ncbi:hypothetical protein UFOVP1146_420 [uncultured Caudovirales phage]|uniref:Uncharacterized protein n=1 Tax=uncultured Caudovirales phage TaxID=2100421 RepID=A0A6J5P951_9CAUD|nr:hypothetical protein UFOVP812_333 [uncultured Caudovirales phage]CAB4165696.1 hypothetical protein UFOVP818_232 [uncultured Caudovirales phage]CAB4187074.1 hypothetical protein UFOVP1146_420 [uncultured Caudovirales phage]CAB4221084.1 hypothetical protein UFOVP1638_145 [uncultured Caudovirales phage]
MTKFEQLVEYVINDDEAKAKALFHDIVVEKSREIYEDLMQDEEGVEEDLGGDPADQLINDVEADETGMTEEEDEEEDADDAGADIDAQADDFGDEEGGEFGDEEGGEEPATKDDILNLEDKLDQLMAEFEELLDTENGDMDADMDDMGDEELAPDAGGDAYAVDDTSEFDNEELAEAVNLKAAPKPVTSEEGNTYKKSPVAANAGAKGALAKPVSSGANDGGRHDAPGVYGNSSKELIGKVGNSPAGATQRLTPATKPHLAQATGVNTKSPVSKS